MALSLIASRAGARCKDDPGKDDGYTIVPVHRLGKGGQFARLDVGGEVFAQRAVLAPDVGATGGSLALLLKLVMRDCKYESSIQKMALSLIAELRSYAGDGHGLH